MVHDFNVTIDRNYATRDNTDATPVRWLTLGDVTENMWRLIFASRDSKHVTINM